MTRDRDAFGHLVADYAAGKTVYEVIERDDGYVSVQEPVNYFEPFRRWEAIERRAIRRARGRVLDVGCGPGRIALHLQERGHEVVAIDSSPLTVALATRRGVRDARLLRFENVTRRLGTFDTVVLMGNNFGLFGDRRKAVRMLRRLLTLTTRDARIVASSNDPSSGRGDHPIHAAYRRQNSERGRMPGQVTLRVRYEGFVGPWFDYLLVTPSEMSALAEAGGWKVSETFFAGGPHYAAVLERSLDATA